MDKFESIEFWVDNIIWNIINSGKCECINIRACISAALVIYL